ncbi:hypothetical protein ACVWWP_005000 [Bradyrhizobium sp. LM3.6]
MTSWQNNRAARDARIAAGAGLARGKIVEAHDVTRLLEAVIRSGDRVCLEGDNQKQADLLSRALLAVDLSKVNDLHMVQSGVVLPEHLDLFDRGVAKRLDYAYSGPQSARIARMLFGGKIELGAVHTYLELFARYFIDLTPHVALIAAVSADRDGNLYTGPNTEDTPTVVEATAFKDGVVIAQVNEIVETVPRVDIPADRVHFIVRADKPFFARAAVHARPGCDHGRPDTDGDARDQGSLCSLWCAAAQSRYRLQHRRDRAPVADLRRKARAERQHCDAFRVEPASGADSGDRVRLGPANSFVRLGGRHG